MAKAFSTLKVRSGTAIILGLIILSAILYSRATAAILFGLICVMSSYEYVKISRRDFKDTYFNLAFLAGLAPYLASFVVDWDSIYYVALLLASILYFLIAWFFILFRPKAFDHHHWTVLTCLLYIGIPFFALSQCLLQQWSYPKWIILCFLLFIWVADMGAYFAGSLFGKHKLFKRVSPGKTIEGFLGGAVLNIVAAIIFSYYFSFLSVEAWIGLGLIIWFFGTAGDLFESALKRLYNIKDSSNILPGHGGFLDRFDSFIFSIPFVIIYLMLIGHLNF